MGVDRRNSFVEFQFRDRIMEWYLATTRDRKNGLGARYHLSSIYFTISNDICRAFRLALRNVNSRLNRFLPDVVCTRKRTLFLPFFLSSCIFSSGCLVDIVPRLMLPRTSSVVGYHGQSCVTWLTAPLKVTFPNV